jgi:hypothetical protein
MGSKSGKEKSDEVPEEVSSSENSSTVPVTIRWLMSQPEFAAGVADARAGRPPKFEQWEGNGQWSYERGRAWALLVPRTIALTRSGKVTPEAIAWFRRVGKHIL